MPTTSPGIKPSEELDRWLDNRIGSLEPGSALPTEQELARSFDLSVGTVRRVLRRYQESGAVVRARTLLKIEHPDHFLLEQWGFDPETSEWIPMQRTSYEREQSEREQSCRAPRYLGLVRHAARCVRFDHHG